MRSLLPKLYLLLLVVCTALPHRLRAQNTCYDCNVDSLLTRVNKTANNAEKIRLLQQSFSVFLITGKRQVEIIDRLAAINEKAALINMAPYQIARKALSLHVEKKYAEALPLYQQAITEFDKAKIDDSNLLMNIRLLYNSLDRQEERYAYYQQKLNYYLVNGPAINVAVCYHGLGGYYILKADYNRAISCYLKEADIIKKFSYLRYVTAIGVVGGQYVSWGNFNKATFYLNIYSQAWRKLTLVKGQTSILAFQAFTNLYKAQKKYPEALKCLDTLLADRPGNVHNRDYAFALLQKSEIYLDLNLPVKADPLIKLAKAICDTTFNGHKIYATNGIVEIDFIEYLYYKATKNYTLAEKSLITAFTEAKIESDEELVIKYARELAQFYAGINKVAPAKLYLDKYIELSDAFKSKQNATNVAAYESEQRDNAQAEKISALREQRKVQEAVINKSQLINTISFAAILIISCALFFIYRQSQTNKKTLASLKATQTQLIQAEKMASLGELTAGIAHEIQNPLNFVNNFSEVSVELLTELKQEVAAGHTDDVMAIADDLTQNLEKIHHHGKRADFIVKGMLQHSRTSTGEKQLTNINTIADEFLKLSYHGLRAKDKSFNTELITNYDESLPKVNIAQQDIGRVLLNLFNNAFYAVNQKKKTGGADYKPEVTVSTSINDGRLNISVKDNGNGIPDAIKDKIMQPFFTTKPTGEGTGLGLSLSYDIVVKGHGGKIDVNTKEGEFTEFIVTLPLS